MNRQLLAALSLAPLLGASQTLQQAATIALLSVLLVLLHRLCMTPLRRQLSGSAMELVSVLIAAALASCANLTLLAWALPLRQTLGIYPELIALQCVLFEYCLGRTGHWPRVLALLAGFATLHIVLGACRELLGSSGLRLASLMPGGLLLLGVALAIITRARSRRAASSRKGSP
ncbi:MAG: Rnf-Nqr domain containing protein [Pseudomonas sp.]